MAAFKADHLLSDNGYSGETSIDRHAESANFATKPLPPVRAFWSLTMYNDKQAFPDNPIDRYAIGDRDKLKFDDDGSLTIYIQRESPGKDKESNWLPAPKSGGFSMNLRLYWPKPEALDGTWKPAAVVVAD